MTEGAIRSVIIENEAARVAVLPELGGMISEFVHKRAGRDLLFHHPRLNPRPAYYRAPVDDWWTGGVIEGMPTGFSCTVDGDLLPDFGELWPEPWQVALQTSSSATLTCATRIVPLRMTREMHLMPSSSVLHMRHQIENLSDRPVSFIWGIHPTMPVGPDTVIQAAARLEELSIPEPAGLDLPDGPRRCAFADGPVSFASIAIRGQRFSYLSDLPEEGWFAVWDRQWKVGLGMSFSGADLPCLWLWLLDGWRGMRAVTLEPWTGWPGALSDAIRLGRARKLEPGGRFETETRLIGFETSGPLRGFDGDGAPLRG